MRFLKYSIWLVVGLSAVLSACASRHQIDNFKQHESKNALIVVRVGSETKTHDFSSTIKVNNSGVNVFWSRYAPVSPRTVFSSAAHPNGKFVAYSLPPGRYRIREAELSFRNIPVVTGFAPDKGAANTSLMRHTSRASRDGKAPIVFDARPGEAVYVGDIIYEIRSTRDAYKITVRDRFSEARSYFAKTFPDAAIPLTRRLTRYDTVPAR